jgi:hypothetical protein
MGSLPASAHSGATAAAARMAGIGTIEQSSLNRQVEEARRN